MVPLFSIYSNQSCGIGEYLDLLPLIAWCRTCGFDVIQLLPLNDTGLGTSPYDAISAFALNPTYVSLRALPYLERMPQAEERLQKIAYWTQTERVKHHIVRELKQVFLREYLGLVGSTLSEDPAFIQFVQEQSFWLPSYSLFKSLKEFHYWKKWEEWPEEHRSLDRIQELLAQPTWTESMRYHELLQFLCFQQLSHVQKIASAEGVLLTGDVPILINKESADVWFFRSLFECNESAGAPPDFYAPEGQNWGFPLYNWKAMEESQYRWWKERIRYATSFYQVYRLDHIVGFFRIWAIAPHGPASEGRFIPAEDDVAMQAGKRHLSHIIADSSLLPIGEDLGSVPPYVRHILSELGICGTKVMRWERDYQGDQNFIPIENFPQCSMTTVSTHDSDLLRGWWVHAPKEAHLFASSKGWLYLPFLSTEHLFEILRDSHQSNSLFHVNLLQEYLALIPELAQTPNRERINIPGKVLDSNWTYRYPISIEALAEKEDLKDLIIQLLDKEHHGSSTRTA